MKLRLGVAIAAVVVALAVFGLVVHRRTRAQPTLGVSNTESAPPDRQGEDVTVLLDFSASFAPYGQSDRLALGWVSGALQELATKWWNPPVTIIWRRIGTSSLLPRPICDAVEFSPRMTDGGQRVEAFKKAVSSCLSAVNRQEMKGEPYTDITGAVAAAVQSREFSTANKILMIFSDFKEDQAPATHPAPFQMKGETVVMLHRPGTDETSMSAYLGRIRQWSDLFKQRGAGRVLTFPLGLMTQSDLVQSMRPSKLSGTAATILVDFKDQFNLGKSGDSGDMRYLQTLAHSVAGMAGEWQPPVTVRLGVVPVTALRMRWMRPQVFQQSMVHVEASGLEGTPTRSVDNLEMGMDESIQGLKTYANSASAADLVGAISLARAGSETESQRNYLFIVSDFIDTAGLPASLQSSLRGARVVMVYRPASKDGADEQGFFARIKAWKQLFLGAGAESVCETEMATLTGRSIRECLRM